MSNDKAKEKKKIWLYAGILFASAFVLLFFTAYSQLNLNKNINEYKNQLNGKDQEKSNSELDFNTSLQLNSKLSNQLKAVDKELEDLKNKYDAQRKIYSESEKKYNDTIKTYDSLIIAESLYGDGDFTTCAITLIENCVTGLLSKKALERYNFLKKKTFSSAAITLYFKGYKKFKTADYREAIKNFQLSTKISLNEYVSDDCYYFIALSAYKINNLTLAKDNINLLLKKFPDSSYFEDAKLLSKKIS